MMRVMRSVAFEDRMEDARAARLNAMARRLRNRVLMGRIKLPLLEDGLAEILNCAMSGELSMADLIRVIEGRPLIAARVLSFANSALYGGRGSTSSVRLAAFRLGLSQLRELMIQAIADACVFQNGSAGTLLAERRHAIACACIMRKTAGLGAIEPDIAFTCGLLHDMGRPILWQVLASELDETVDGQARTTLIDLLHPMVGERVAINWNLPQCVADCARLHHCVDDPVGEEPGPELGSPHTALIRAVALADRLAHTMFEYGDAWLGRVEGDAAWPLRCKAMSLSASQSSQLLHHIEGIRPALLA